MMIRIALLKLVKVYYLDSRVDSATKLWPLRVTAAFVSVFLTRTDVSTKE